MLRRILMGRLNVLERELGVSVEYVRHILRTSLRCFRNFARIIPLASYRRRLPVDACHVARLVVTRHADCGTCLQIAVNEARKAGVSVDTVQAVLADDADRLPEGLAEVYRFALGVVGATGDEDAVRESLRTRYGEEALIELAMTIASSSFFPVVKRALGYAVSCSRVEVSV
jgi:alkylhydroperoxidase family enzyme